MLMKILQETRHYGIGVSWMEHHRRYINLTAFLQNWHHKKGSSNDNLIILDFFCQADIMMNFHLGEMVTSLQRATLIPGGSESLVYTTLSGGIGMLVAFTSHEVWRSRKALLSFTYHMSNNATVVIFGNSIFFVWNKEQIYLSMFCALGFTRFCLLF